MREQFILRSINTIWASGNNRLKTAKKDKLKTLYTLRHATFSWASDQLILK